MSNSTPRIWFLCAASLMACGETEKTATGVDGIDSGGTSVNERPTVSGVSIVPVTATTLDDLVVEFAVFDPEGDEVEVYIEWSRDGLALGPQGSTLSATETAKGQVWTVAVWASDGTGDGTPSSADSVTIANAAPGAFAVQVEPALPTAQVQDLRCDVIAPPEDADLDALSYAVAWAVDGVAFGEVSTNVLTGDTVPASATEDAQVWSCVIVASDGEATVESNTAEVDIGPAFGGWAGGLLNLAEADQVFFGEGEAAWAGIDVASAGDVDGDGRADVLIGAEGATPSGELSGTSYLFRSVDLFTGEPLSVEDASWSFEGDTAYDYAGHSLDSAGDVDGDGLDDLLLTAHNDDTAEYNAGAVSIFLASELGEPGGARLMSSAEHVLYGEGERSYTGFAVAKGGDTDVDGLADVLIGAFGNRDREFYRGKAYLVRGQELLDGEASLSEVGTTMWGEAQRDYAGWVVSAAGDVDGDGREDLLVGAPGQDEPGEDAGKAYLVLAASLDGLSEFELSDADLSMWGEQDSDWAGYAVAGPGDVDGDGSPDLLIGALQSDSAGEDAGIVYLVTDAGALDGSPMPLNTVGITFLGVAEFDQAGRRVASAGDVDGDGRGDLLIASTDADAELFENGCTYLLLASSVPESGAVSLDEADAQFVGAMHFDQAGWGLDGAGDVDGDGLDDLLVGAPYNDTDASEAGSVHLVLSR